MKIYCEKDYEAMSRRAAGIIGAQIILKADSVLGLATGSSPIGTYEELIRRYQAGELDFSHITSVNLDEYRGLSGDNDQSYRYFMDTHLFSHVNIQKGRTFVPDGLGENPEKTCEEYNQIILREGPVDLQLLGMGNNGHIGFNEPAEAFAKKVHCVDLTESTIEANKRFFERIEDVPRQAYTMGIGNIMQAKKVLVIVSGEGKADIVAKAFAGPVTPWVPASILQFHEDVTLVGDEAALSKLTDLMGR